MADERWTPETVQLVTDAWVRAFYRDEEGGLGEDELDAGRCVLAALADAGLLLPPGGEMREEFSWSHSDGTDCTTPVYCRPDSARVTRRITEWPDGTELMTPWRPVDPQGAQP